MAKFSHLVCMRITWGPSQKHRFVVTLFNGHDSVSGSCIRLEVFVTPLPGIGNVSHISRTADSYELF